MGKGELQGGWGWMCEWVGSRVGVGPVFCSLHFSPSPSKEGMDWGSCHLTCECSEDGPGVFRKLPFFAPHPSHFSSRSSMEFLSHSQSQRRGFVGWVGGESERKSLGKVKGALCRLAAWYRSNLSSSSSSSGGAGENATASPLHGTGTIWPPCENCSWLGSVGVQLSRWNTLSPSGRTIPSAALTRKEFLYHSSHNKEERERSRAGGRRSEVRGGEGCTVRGEEDIVCLWLWATEKHELSGHVWVCLESVFVCGLVWMSGLDWVCLREYACACVWGAFSLGCWSREAVQRMLKQSWIFFSPLSLLFEWWLRTGWIPLLMLFGSIVL